MVYVNNDLFSTIVLNDKSGKVAENKSILIKEIASLIKDGKDSVVEALTASGVSIGKSASANRVVDVLWSNLKNQNVLRGIAFLIYHPSENESEQATVATINSLAGLIGKTLSKSQSDMANDIASVKTELKGSSKSTDANGFMAFGLIAIVGMAAILVLKNKS